MSRTSRPNVVFVLADQLRACSLPCYGYPVVVTPNIDRLAREGMRFTNAISTCPLCTPYRSMLLTGRHPQTTGHVVNFVRTRSDEISIADVFRAGGYRTGWVGKWHLTCGSFVGDNPGPEYIPEGRDRLGFEYFRAYNYSTRYFDGWLCGDDWHVEQWNGYETEGLWPFAEKFMAGGDDRPFCLFISPHQPHQTAYKPYAPEHYYDRVSPDVEPPANVPPELRERAREMLRHYLAMTAAVDDLLGRVLQQLKDAGQEDNTLVVFASDHGTTGGAHGTDPWMKKVPYEEVINVPLVARWPGVLPAGRVCDELLAPVDHFSTLCGLCGLKPPPTVEGTDLSDAWRGEKAKHSKNAVLLMDFSRSPDFAGMKAGDPRIKAHYTPWRGVRTKQNTIVHWQDGRVALYDLAADPLQRHNLADEPAARALRAEMESRLNQLLAERNDTFPADTAYGHWFDQRRRIVANVFGPLGDPEADPDPTLFEQR